RYGKDKTFVVPILSNCALAGLVPWSDVPPLPFEAAWLPQELYRWARMPVVSYAIPALVAIGQARFHFAPPRNPLLRVLRRRGRGPTLRVLRNMQPASGGYLEATPLTSFVLMSLAAVGNGHLPVARDCLRFLLDSRLPDGSWPIDTNLATWLTSLSIQAVARRWGTCTLPSVAGGQTPDATGDATEDGAEAAAARLSAENSAVGSPAAATVASPTSPVAEPLVTAQTVRWLLSCQHRRRHPFTGANPGGWGWTDLSGAVPDADDTPAALLALHAIDWRPAELQRLEQQALDAVCQGLAWLLRLQNRDGGWPTFCRGWGTLPFDRSGTDLTAHVLRAFAAWLPQLDRVRAAAGRTVPQASQLQAASRRGLAYLGRTQQPDGSWLPLWFGNQDRPAEDNPAYGTGKVLLAYGALGLQNCRPAQRGMDYLRENQNKDGGWGGGPSVRYPGLLGKPPLASGDFSSTIEETAVAVEGLCSCSVQPRADATIMQALDWLAQAVHSGNLRCSWPIGFYFAKLWYHERLYPAIFSLSAFGAALHPVRPNISR
ncbi:MAG: hypothetical protein KDA45_03020, partial [Planctomycetales bacterium]|nr:hypothetical protein [Planctomycetales bacterium]